jgi:hypothetical protein
MPHPDEGLIHAWLDGELDPAEAARVEALVASDPAWAAAAAEARGLIAASARIVGTLDRVPANVIPKAAAPKRSGSRWMWRAAAAVVLVAGSAVVLQRENPELPVAPAAPAAQVTKQAQPPVQEHPLVPKASAPVAAKPNAGAPAGAVGGAAANAPVADSKNVLAKKEVESDKAKDVLRDQAGASAASELRANAAPAPAASGASAASAARRQAALPAEEAGKLSRLQPGCFEQREPRDSAGRLIRLDAVALSDSVRLEKLTLRGDTIAAVRGAFIAVRVRCPAP